MSYETSLRIAQLKHDAALLAGPPEDWRDDLTTWATEATLSDLEWALKGAQLRDDTQEEYLIEDLISERPRPEDLDLYFLPDGENTAVIFDDATGTDWSTWPLWLEAVCPGYTRTTALRIAHQSLRDTRRWLHEVYIP